DGWPEHIEAIKRNGVKLGGTQGSATVPIKALHINEVQGLASHPIDIAFISVKSYDTEWATMLIKQYLAPQGFAVSLQNCINEERIANIVGWGKTLGCIASTIGVSLDQPGTVVRTYKPGGAAYTVFRVGEVHGRTTRRVRELAGMLSAVDSTEITNDLWGERWSKLAANSMHNGLAALTGLGHTGVYGQVQPRRIAIRLGGEAVRVGRALGFDLESIRGIPADALEAAAYGDAQALSKVEQVISGWMTRMTDEGRPSTAQDVLKGRRTEIDYINGMVVDKAAELGLPAPTQAAILKLVKRVEAGELAPGVENIAGL
ncbi:MAG TPA: ketopantoate reductase C-terminal domain-containing protein, partial [Casimicrobiaceae bacterium]|nr:ketopantoate reductase C-terminal domain-containing protein [Casimicrobiaceae bacterium]